MNRYIEYQNKVLVPIQVVEMSFHEKEEISLSPFQSFILEAIDSGNGLNEIVKATLLTRNVVEAEIIQMINQKLLVREEENIVLSDLSKKIRMISSSVINLNKEKKFVFINLMTGDIEAFDQSIIVDDKGEKELSMCPKITERDLDGISLEENTMFLGSYMDSFSGMDKNDVETILGAVFVEFKTIGKKQYIKKILHRIPCVIGGDVLQSQIKDSITARGLMYQVKYQVESEIVNKYKAIISELAIVNDNDSQLLSEKGLCILEKHKICKDYSAKELVCFYDTISGQFHFNKQRIKQSKNTQCNLQLPILYDLSDDVKNNIVKKIRKHYSISDDFIIKEVFCDKESYSIDCELSDLWGEEYAEC